jgi:hypothetical protein
MTSVKKYSRYKKGHTDYYHRGKTLTNYHSIIRLKLIKKVNYYIAGLYQTTQLNQPDVCLGYFESRWLRNKDNKKIGHNLIALKEFGKVIGKQINRIYISKELSKKLILDLGRRKKICYMPFISGILCTLNEQFRPYFAVSQKILSETLHEANAQCAVFYSEDKKSK